MSLIPIVSDGEASPEQAVLFEYCTKMLGRVANAIRVASHSPKVAQALLGFMIPTIREEVTGLLGVQIKALTISPKTLKFRFYRIWGCRGPSKSIEFTCFYKGWAPWGAKGTFLLKRLLFY